MTSSRFLYKARCTHHKDDVESMAVYSDTHVHCFGCGYHDYVATLPQPPAWYGGQQGLEPQYYTGPIPWSMARAYQGLLQGPFKTRKAWLYGRGLRSSTIEKLHLGHTGRAFSIPVWDSMGRLETIRYRRDDRVGDPDAPKYRSLKGAKVTLYGGWQSLSHKQVLLCEGELDTARLLQELWLHSLDDVVALSLTGGCNSLTDTTVRLLQVCAPRAVWLLYDQDHPGAHAAGAAQALLTKHGLSPRICRWPTEWGKDVTEALSTVGFASWWDVVCS